MSRRTFNTGVLRSIWKEGKAAYEAEMAKGKDVTDEDDEDDDEDDDDEDDEDDDDEDDEDDDDEDDDDEDDEDDDDEDDDDILDQTRNGVTTEAYQYQSLEGQSLPLRLVELLPGTREEDIACRMYETRLDECTGSYEALSYVWGDDSEKTPIQIDGQTLEIGTNLQLALLNLREPDTPRTLWIDAICINQGKTSERNQQVAIMDDIYRRARRTVVWLRDEVERQTDAAISILEDLADDAISRSRKRGNVDGDDEDGHIVHINNLPVSMIEKDGVKDPMFVRYKNDISAQHILLSPWWYRAWTLQEILLASSTTMVIGRSSIDWERMRIGANHGLSLGIWTPITMGIIQDPILKPFLSIQWLKLQRRMRDTAESPGQALLELLFQCRFRQATNPRDKIYSLLGLVASDVTSTRSIPLQLPLGIKPDYSSPVDAVYTDVARKMMRESNTLDVLGGCGGAPDPDPDLPSWVPDWNTAQPARPLLHDAFGQRRATHATAHSRALPRFIDTGNKTLVLHAHEVATLTALAPSLAQPIVDSDKIVSGLEKGWEEIFTNDNWVSRRFIGGMLGMAWESLTQLYKLLTACVPFLAAFAEWETFATAVPPTNPGSRADTSLSDSPDEKSEEPGDGLAVYWQTLCTGTYDDSAAESGQGRKIATQKLFYTWRASLKPISDLHRWKVDQMLRSVAYLGYVVKTMREYGDFARFLEGSYGRRLGRAANGYLCLLPATAEVGDKLVLARGGRVPLVVREEARTKYWRLVGEAYVQGIMDGQAWEEDKCEEFKLR